jgi:hypothetical protein
VAIGIFLVDDYGKVIKGNTEQNKDYSRSVILRDVIHLVVVMFCFSLQIHASIFPISQLISGQKGKSA